MSEASVAATSEVKPLPVLAGASFAVVVLTAMNLLNYVDRWVPSAVKVLFQKDLHLTDSETSYPTTAFVVVYMCASPLFGALADRFPRKRLIAAGVALWSAATAAAAFASGFWSFLFARATVGIGEAAYATLSPSLLSDFFPPAKRNRVFTFFYMAIPVGAALGFTLGGVVGQHHGWRAAFLVCGLPGVLTALAALLIKEPARGTFDAPAPAVAISWPRALKMFARHRPYVLTVVGYTLVTFASGALADWFPTFLHRHRGFGVSEAATLVGATGAIGGLVGTFAGGFIADRLKGRTRQPYLALSGFSMLIGTIFAVLAFVSHGKAAITAFIFIAQLFFWFYNGPVNAIIVNSVGADLRARAVSLSILCIHLFGDAASPSVVGMVSDATHSLPFALSLVPIALAGGTAVWLYAWRSLPEHAVAE